jgi:hypothetical protein
MNCPNCRTENQEIQKFCKECGTKLLLVCPDCRFENAPGDKFCGECGYPLSAPAIAMGLGTCWARLVQGAVLSSPQLKKELGIPENHPHHYPMMLGYPKPKYFRLPERRAPKINWK